MNSSRCRHRRWPVSVALALVLAWPLTGRAQEAEPAAEESPVKWQSGPSTAKLGALAEIQVPAGYLFAGADDTRLILESMENPTSGSELGFLAPTNLEWFVIFEFDDVGYVKDDDKDELDADAMLTSIRDGTAAANKERKRRGWAEINVVGWEVPPKYDAETHNLEWAIRGESLGRSSVNYNTRLLGRRGVMSVALVLDPEQLTATLPVFKSLLKDYQYVGGERYAEWRQGDKLAAYGLTALVVGGGLAAAAKTGALAKFFKMFWKLLIVIVAAVAGLLKKILTRFRGAPADSSV